MNSGVVSCTIADLHKYAHIEKRFNVPGRMILFKIRLIELAKSVYIMVRDLPDQDCWQLVSGASAIPVDYTGVVIKLIAVELRHT